MRLRTSLLKKQGSLAAPLREPAFVVLWVGVAAAFLSQWMLPVAAQWYLVALPGGLPLVPLVQVAISLPMALFAFPAGVLADNLDRRRMIIAVQSVALAAELVLIVLAVSDLLRPVTLFVLLAVLSSTIVLTYTPFNSMVPDLVTRESIPSAAALLAIATNSTRIVGPALSGFAITLAGVEAGFTAAVPPTLLLLTTLVLGRRRRVQTSSRERFMPAVRSGIRYVRHSPQALKITVRCLWFTTGIVGLLSLMPVVATRLGADSAQLGLLLAGQGVGAVLGAVTIPQVRRRASPNVIVAASFAVGGGGLLIAGLAPNLLVIGLGNLAVGWAWTTALATLQAAMQLYLPAWVRARGIAVTLVAVHGGQGLGALGQSVIADVFSARVGLLTGAVVLLAGTTMALWWPLNDLLDVDRSMIRDWSAPELIVDPQQLGGRVQVRVVYTVPGASEDEFVADMHVLRRIRLRTGALRWQLLRHMELPDRFIEEFTVGSWDEFEQQMAERSVAHERKLQSRAAAFSMTPVETHYLIQVETSEDA